MQRFQIPGGVRLPIDLGSSSEVTNLGPGTLSYADTELEDADATVAPGSSATLSGTRYLWGGLTVRVVDLSPAEGPEVALGRLAALESTRALDSEVRKYYPVPTGGNDAAELESRLNAGEKDIQLRAANYTFTANVANLAGKSGVRIRGNRRGGTAITTNQATGNMLNMTGSSFCEISGITLSTSVQRTAGALIFLDAGAGTCQQNKLSDLWMLSGYRGIVIEDVSTLQVDDVQFGDVNAAWTWDSAIRVQGAAISCKLNRILGGTAAGMTSGFAKLNNGAMDSLHCSQWDVLNFSPSSGMLGVVHDGGTWSKFTDCSIECGNLDAFTINGGWACNLATSHLIGLHGLVVAGGTGFKMIGGEILVTAIHSIALAAGVNTLIDGVTVMDVGAGYNCIEVSNGVNDFTIIGCDLGRNYIGSGQPDRLIRVGASANAQDRYVVTNNRGRNFTGAAGLLDNGTGANKTISGNVFIA